jgi:hypothetical protein
MNHTSVRGMAFRMGGFVCIPLLTVRSSRTLEKNERCVSPDEELTKN